MLCVNLFIDYFILYAEQKILHIQVKHRRILLGALLGAIATIPVFFPFYTVLFSVIYRPASAILIVLTAFGFSSIQKLLIRTMTFLGFNMLLCGGVLCLELLFDPRSVAIYNDTVYFDISPMVLIIATLLIYLGITLYHRISNKHKLRCCVRRITLITDEDSKLSFESAVDTGCNLKEPFSGESVILAERRLFENIKIPEEKMRVIPFATMSGEGALMGFKPKSVMIDGKPLCDGCYVAICEDRLKGEIKSIMGTELSEAI